LEENKSFKIEIPEFFQESNKKNKNNNNNAVGEFKKSIKLQYDELMSYQDLEITNENKKSLESLILATEDLINNCMADNKYSGNRDQYFVNLIFICHKLSLRIETYKIEEKIKELDNKNQSINRNQQKLEKKQIRAEEKSNNLVYNLLGFLTSFSIVSAVVGTIKDINGIVNIMLFMAFTVLILLTTLIALHNFYKNDNKRENKLQDNYFLWKVVLGVIIVLFIILSIKTMKDNRENIFNYIDNKIESVIEKKLGEN